MNRNFAVTVARVNARWQVSRFKDDFSSYSTAVQAVRSLRNEEAAFALLCVEDDYFVIVRPTPGGVRLLLSDATAAIEDSFAAEILDEMDVEIPDISPDEVSNGEVEPWAEGDFEILADLGVSEQVMAIICGETDWWASEQLQNLTEELGCEAEFDATIGLDDANPNYGDI
ncbi:MAG: tRNA adenosine deaminase-associated protein [Corynebacterium sp.]|nr:tRNA adenosine deaminase-associated protein [Corynebacterium sp.]